MIDYGFTKELDMSYERALEVIPEKLQKEGFGILTTIDIKEKLKEKIDVEFKKYMILGACHPASAHMALQAEENIGLMLPCNVIVYEKGEKTVVSFIKPSAVMGDIDNPELKAIADEVEGKLKGIFDSIPNTG